MPKPSPRRDGREAAVQFLFANETPAEDFESEHEVIELFWTLRTAKAKAKQFAEQLIMGVRAHQEEIDEKIKDSLTNFNFDRLTAVDRSILRLGTFEICFFDEVPGPVALNESIEIAKRFGTEDSAKFVNGVLDRILKESTTNS